MHKEMENIGILSRDGQQIVPQFVRARWDLPIIAGVLLFGQTRLPADAEEAVQIEGEHDGSQVAAEEHDWQW